MNLSEDLNESQRKAVEYIDGPSLVIAGAGSGKTRVLTYKIAFLLEKGLEPWNILALTFTNKAANEMKERIGQLVGIDKARYLNMGTFHSIFSRILRAEATLLNYTSSFTIYDESDSRSLIKTITKEMGLDDKLYKPATVHSRISMAKNHLVSAENYACDNDLMEYDKTSRIPSTYKIYNAYNQRCKKANAMDFDDLLALTYQLFDEHPDVCKKYAERFQYVLVDEYQDTNYVQQSIVLQLTKENQRVCVVGDDYQSIYGFRGANIDNILDFKQIYNDPKLFKLEENYRSTQNIVNAANSLMKHNERQIPKDVFSNNSEGNKIVYKATYSDKEEACIVCKDIKEQKIKDEKSDFSSFAILYRTNSQSRSFEDEMLKENIPYRVYGGLSFYQRKEIKDIISYFRLIVNTDDEEAFKRILNYPTRGIGNTTLQKISDCAVNSETSFWHVVSNPDSCKLNVNKGTLAKINNFVGMINTFREQIYSVDAFKMGQDIIIQSGIQKDIFSSSDPEDVSRQENVQELLASLQGFVVDKKEQGDENVSLSDYLQEVSLQTDLDSDDDKNEDNKVTLMTIHSSKGLEYPYVFVVGMDENIFPSQRSMDNIRNMEEERRLLYVAITRAKKYCELTSAQNRYRYGKSEFFAPSRFLKDIDSKYISKEDGLLSSSKKDFGIRQWGSYDDNIVSNKYTDSYDNGTGRTNIGSKNQNSRPVATQFMADVKSKATLSHGNYKKLSSVEVPVAHVRPLSRLSPSSINSVEKPNPSASLPNGLKEGSVIVHQRFGIGIVTKIEGTGENTKATVKFKNAQTKQLLLKFAKYTISKE